MNEDVKKHLFLGLTVIAAVVVANTFVQPWVNTIYSPAKPMAVSQ